MDKQRVPTDFELEILQLLQSGNRADLARAVEAIQTWPTFVRVNRSRCRQKLDQEQMLHSGQLFYSSSAEEDALFHIFTSAFSEEQLARTILVAGGGFDPSKGSLLGWLIRASGYKLRDWVRSRRKLPVENPNQESRDLANNKLGTYSQPKVQADEIRQLKVKLRDALANLPNMPRACMIVRYLDDRDRDVLLEDDVLTLLHVRAKSGDHVVGTDPESIEQIRCELDELWMQVVTRAAITGANDDDINTSRRKLEVRVDVLLLKRQRNEHLMDHYRRRLDQLGLSDSASYELEQLAESLNQKQIEEFECEFMEQRQFMLAARRRKRAVNALIDAQRKLLDAPELPLPEPREIAQFLYTTASAVSPALTRGHAQVGLLFWEDFSKPVQDRQDFPPTP